MRKAVWAFPHFRISSGRLDCFGYEGEKKTGVDLQFPLESLARHRNKNIDGPMARTAFWEA